MPLMRSCSCPPPPPPKPPGLPSGRSEPGGQGHRGSVHARPGHQGATGGGGTWEEAVVHVCLALRMLQNTKPRFSLSTLHFKHLACQAPCMAHALPCADGVPMVYTWGIAGFGAPRPAGFGRPGRDGGGRGQGRWAARGLGLGTEEQDCARPSWSERWTWGSGLGVSALRLSREAAEEVGSVLIGIPGRGLVGGWGAAGSGDHG